MKHSLKHIGFIMDGNRRWAKAEGVSVVRQHNTGFENIAKIFEACRERVIECVSFWGLAYKNIQERSPKELKRIYSLIEDKLPNMQTILDKYQTRFEYVGEIELLPKSTQDTLIQLKKATAHHTQGICIIALAYGGKREMVRAVQRCIAQGVDPDTLDEKKLLSYLDTGAFPPPDMIVRTGGDQRHSGYFLYQSEYSEYFFSQKYWPEFDLSDLDGVCDAYLKTKRNFGK